MGRRIAWYALGGGLGHLNRTLAIMRHFRPLVPDAGVLLLTSSAYSHLAMNAGIPVLRVPGVAEGATFPAGMIGALVAGALARLAPLDLLVVDTFPGGLHAELTPDVLGQVHRRALIARPYGPPIEPEGAYHYHEILVPTPSATSGVAVGYVLNRQPGETLDVPDARRQLALPPSSDMPVILGLHAGDPGEVQAFFAQIRAASAALGRPHTLRLITPLPLPGPPPSDLVHTYPASEVLGAADLVLAGAGYNTAAELGAHGIRALLRPFERSHDQQARRVDPARAFDAMTTPPELATQIARALEEPAPAPWPTDDVQGAQRAARALAALLNRPPA